MEFMKIAIVTAVFLYLPKCRVFRNSKIKKGCLISKAMLSLLALVRQKLHLLNLFCSPFVSSIKKDS